MTGTPALSRYARADVVLVALLAAHVVIKAALFARLAHAPVVGDEAAYVDGARALSNLVRDLSTLGPVDSAELQRNVVASGWFMPGMSIVLTPLFVVDPDASITAIRAYIGVTSTLLLVFTVVSVRRVLGTVYACAVVVFPGLVPMWLLFSYGAWGDLSAGLVIVLVVVYAVEIARRLRVGAAPSPRQGVRFGLAAIVLVYFRSSASPLVIGAAVLLIAAVIGMLRGRARLVGLGSALAAGAVFMALLLPWSVFASKTLGDRVVTTTSVPIVLANTFGDRDEVCFGPCDPGSTIWFDPLRYSREVAAATGTSEIEVQRQMSAYARSDVTAHSYARDVLADFGRYVSEPAQFAGYLLSPGVSDGGVVQWAVISGTNVMFFAMVGVAVAMMLAVFRRSFDAQTLSIAIKLGLAALLMQPFVHIAGSRYWTSAAPLCALGVGLLLQTLAAWRREETSEDESRVSYQGATTQRVLTGVQVVLAAATVAIFVGVIWLAQ